MQIEKQLRDDLALPNPRDYDQEQASFSWEAARRELDGLSGGRGRNMAYEAIGRHVANGHGDQIAIIWLGVEISEEDYGKIASFEDAISYVAARI